MIIRPSILALVLFTAACAEGQPLAPSDAALQAKGDAPGTTTAAAWIQTKPQVFTTALDQCLAVASGGQADTAALTAAGYAPHQEIRLLPPGRAGFKAVPRVEVVGPFAVEHERAVLVYFDDRGCAIESADSILPTQFTAYFEARGFTTTDRSGRGRLAFTKAPLTLDFSATRKFNRGAGPLAAKSIFEISNAAQ